MKKYLALFLLLGCAAEPATEADLQEESLQQVCSPGAVFFEYMRSHEKVQTCYQGSTPRSDGSWSPSTYCYYQPDNGAPRISRGLGVQREGLVLANTKAYDIYACLFEQCNLYDISVSCNCSYCSQIFPSGGAQPL